MFLLRPRRLVTVVVVLAVALAAADVAARVVAQDEIAARARSATEAQSSSASINAFPFLGHLLFDGSVPKLEVRLDNVPIGLLSVRTVDVQLDDTTIDRGALFSDRRVKLTGIAVATATVTVTAGDLSSATGEAVTLPGSGRVLVEVAGHAIAAQLRILDGQVLVLSVAGVPLLSSNLSANPFVPSCALALAIGAGQMTLSCRVSPVPARLIEAIAGS